MGSLLARPHLFPEQPAGSLQRKAEEGAELLNIGKNRKTHTRNTLMTCSTNALVMSPWWQSIWVSHEIGIIIPSAPSLVSNQLQGPGSRQRNIPGWQREPIQTTLPALGFSSLVGRRGLEGLMSGPYKCPGATLLSHSHNCSYNGKSNQGGLLKEVRMKEG